MRAAIDVVLMMKPPPLFLRCGTAAWIATPYRAGVEIHYLVVVLVGDVGERPAPEQAASVVDQPVEPAEGLRSVIDDGPARRRVGHVAVHQRHRTAGLADVVRDRLRRLAAGVVVQPDLGALGRESLGDGGADAGRGAGNQHALAGEIGNGEGSHGVLLAMVGGRYARRPWPLANQEV